jgi:hypothetical protein
MKLGVNQPARFIYSLGPISLVLCSWDAGQFLTIQPLSFMSAFDRP